MNISKLFITFLIFGGTGLTACQNKPVNDIAEMDEQIEIDSSDILSEKVLTADNRLN